MKLPMIPPGFSEPIRLQDLEDSARSQAFKKINTDMLLTNNQDKKNNSMKQLQRQVIRATFSYNLSRNIVALQFEKIQRKIKITAQNFKSNGMEMICF